MSVYVDHSLPWLRWLGVPNGTPLIRAKLDKGHTEPGHVFVDLYVNDKALNRDVESCYVVARPPDRLDVTQWLLCGELLSDEIAEALVRYL
ncbi:hypothetical protein [Deinococcus kurensis]|uniref:hypothetical protein n=1 Tax=Deinococcus kurensis TaxID=2662757 RepID=UPI0012D2FB01|nr:hypothetical protein [Deinococcus kurensis]